MASRSYNPTTEENSASRSSTAYRGCVSKSLQVTGILHVVAGALSIVLGIAAIILKAFSSYLGIPIWGGLLLFVTTGIIGISTFFKPKNKKIVTAYLVMSTISAVFAFAVTVAFGIFAGNEEWYSWSRYTCHPLERSFCESPLWSRILVNALLTLIFFLELVCGVIAASMGCYKVCRCCRQCCKVCTDDPGNTNMVYYAANMGGVPMIAVPSNQCSRPIYIAGGPSGTSNQSGQFMYLAPSPQPQSFVAMPAVSPQNQTVPQLPPPPQHNQLPTQQLHQVQQAQPAGQAGFIPVQGPGQIQPQGPALTQQVPQQQPTQPQQPATVTQQASGLPAGQTGFVQVQAAGQMQPQVFAQAQPVPQAQPTGMAQQVGGYPPGQVGFVQVPGGQIQMVPAVYPQVMMASAPQQPIPAQQPVPVQQPGPAQQPVLAQQPGPTQQPGPMQQSTPTQQPNQQKTAPSKPAEEPVEEEVNEPREMPHGQVSSGQFSDEAALI